MCVCARPQQKEVGGVGGGDAVMEADEEMESHGERTNEIPAGGPLRLRLPAGQRPASDESQL